MSKFIISGFADEIADDLSEQLELLGELGVHYMEMRNVNGKCIVDYSLEEAEEIKKQLAAAGVKLSAIGSPIGKIKITDGFEPHLEKFKHTLKLAKLLEAPYIRMFSFFIPEGEKPEQYREEVLRRWKCFENEARGSGVILLHENEKGIYGDVSSRCLELLENSDKELVKGIFDPANFVQCGDETISAFKKLRDNIAYMHIKDARSSDKVVVAAGEGEGNVAEILSLLDKSGYEGFLSLEPHLATGDIAVCGPELYKKAFKALMKILNQLDAEIL